MTEPTEESKQFSSGYTSGYSDGYAESAALCAAYLENTGHKDLADQILTLFGIKE